MTILLPDLPDPNDSFLPVSQLRALLRRSRAEQQPQTTVSPCDQDFAQFAARAHQPDPNQQHAQLCAQALFLQLMHRMKAGPQKNGS